MAMMEFEKIVSSGEATLLHFLNQNITQRPDKIAYTFLADGEEISETKTYKEVHSAATDIADALREAGIQHGDRVLMLFPSCIEYVVSFFGCLLAGVVAVPLFPPQSQKNSQERVETVTLDCDAAGILTTYSTYGKIKSWLQDSDVLSKLPCVCAESVPQSTKRNLYKLQANPDSVAFLQYTSGSTSAPKGVMVTHRNLVHNAELMRQAMNHSPESVLVSWLPIFHDMGLIGNILQTMYLGAHCVFMPPSAFIQKPLRWLQAISDFKGHTSMAPNFAYDLCCEKISETQKARLDLSSWASALNGSEPVRYETLERFAREFEECGFRRKALYPGYGLAEATLMVSGPKVDEEYRYLTVSFSELAENRISTSLRSNSDNITLVASGYPWCHTTVAIVDPETRRRCNDHQIGEIWISNASVADGYWQKPDSTAETFQATIVGDPASQNDKFLRTGDMGFLRSGQIFVTGRHKEMILIRGQNYYPQDIERSVQNSNPALLVNGGAAFAVDIAGEEKLIVVQEVKRTALKSVDYEEVAADVYRAVSEDSGLQLYALVLIKPARLQKTSSGKIQRRAMCQLYMRNGIESIRHHVYSTTETSLTLPSPLTDETYFQLDEDQQLNTLVISFQNIIARLLQVPQKLISPEKRLIELGIDSIQFVNLRHIITRYLNVKEDVELDLDLDLTALSVKCRNAILDQRQNTTTHTGTVAPREEFRHASLSQNQMSLWLLQNLYPQTYAYNVAVPLKVRAPLNEEKLSTALDQLFDRHDIFKTVYQASPIEGGAEPVGSTLKPLVVIQKAITGQDVDRQIDEFWKQPFNLQKSIPARFLVIEQPKTGFIFLPVFHHIISDMWSVLLFLEEFSALYQEQDLSVLKYNNAPYSAYTTSQTYYLASDRYDNDREFWGDYLQGYTNLDLPSDRQRPAVQDFSGSVEGFEIDNAMAKTIRELARDKGVTAFSIVLAAFYILVHKLSHQQDITVGTATAGREDARFAETIGYFVNPLPIRTNINGSMQVGEYIADVYSHVSQVMKHQQMPFQKIVEHAAKNVDGTLSPIFQVMFVYQSLPRLKQAYPLVLANKEVEFSFNGLPAASVPLHRDCAQFDITLTLVDSDMGFDCRVEYNNKLFLTQRMQNFIDQYLLILEQLVSDPSKQIADIEYTDADTPTPQPPLWHQSDFEPIDSCISHYGDTQPNAMAIVASDGTRTYSDLTNKINQLANWFISQGLHTGDVVGVLMDRSCDYSIVMLAIMRAGGVYLPLDSDLPEQRLIYMLEDAAPRLLVTDAHNLPFVETMDFSRTNTRVIDYADVDQERMGSKAPPRQVAPEQLAYIIYTSGSTGIPKGVLCTHQGLKNCIVACVGRFGLSMQERFLQSASYLFDASIWNSFMCWYAGGCLVVADKMQMLPGPDLVRLINERDITAAFLSPTIMAELSPENLPRLEKVIAGGEALPAMTARKWFSQGKIVFNAYGPTECSICVTTARCDSETWQPHIGRPIDNVDLYLLDDNFKPVAAGVEGEICIAGLSLARGYLNQSAKTHEAFVQIETPTGTVVLYRTGDRAVRDFDGNLNYKGRKDGMVKVSGHRIELEEVRKTVCSVAEIDHASVLVVEEKLVSFYVSSHGDLDREYLHRTIQRTLPRYMIPADFIRLESIPITRNGKTDFDGLAKLWSESKIKRLATQRVPRATTKQDPATAAVAKLWEDVLEHGNFDVDSKFFEVGGTSVLMARLHALLEAQFDKPISMVDLYQYSTIASLSAYLAEGSKTEPNELNRGTSRAAKRKRARARSLEHSE